MFFSKDLERHVSQFQNSERFFFYADRPEKAQLGLMISTIEMKSLQGNCYIHDLFERADGDCLFPWDLALDSAGVARENIWIVLFERKNKDKSAYRELFAQPFRDADADFWTSLIIRRIIDEFWHELQSEPLIDILELFAGAFPDQRVRGLEAISVMSHLVRESELEFRNIPGCRYAKKIPVLLELLFARTNATMFEYWLIGTKTWILEPNINNRPSDLLSEFETLLRNLKNCNIIDESHYTKSLETAAHFQLLRERLLAKSVEIESSTEIGRAHV